MTGEAGVTPSEAFDRLIEACPSFWQASDFDSYIAAFEDQDTPDLYVRTSAFAHHLVHLLEANRPAEVELALAVAEQLFEYGNEDTIELIELGFFEALQNIASHADVLVGPDRIVPLLGERSRGIWEEHEELWRHAGRWLHDGPRVEEADYRQILDPNLRRYFQAHKRRLDDGTLISASDIVNYETQLASISPTTPAGRPKIPWQALIVGLVLAFAAALAMYR